MRSLAQKSKSIGSLSAAVKAFEQPSQSKDGYLNSRLLQIMRDGSNDELVKRFFSGPFAHVRWWLPEMFGIFVSRFPDEPLMRTVIENLGDEFGYYAHSPMKREPTHAQLYRPLLEVLGVKVKTGTVSIPASRWSPAARKFYRWFKRSTRTKPFAYMMGVFLGYEIVDGPDFGIYLKAVKRIWPKRDDIHEFFSIHYQSEHGQAFAKNLEILFTKEKSQMLHGMDDLSQKWGHFYQDAYHELKLK